MKGKLFVISGPSGVGKNTILNRLVEERENVRYSISATSRPIRPGEVDGVSYYFVSREQFEKMIAAGELLEFAEYVGNYYGTPLAPILEATEKGVDIVMDVDVVGALKIKKRVPSAVLIFITAPSFEEIRSRLVHRGDVAPEIMAERLEHAKWEYAQAYQYDYTVMNDTVDHAVARIGEIIYRSLRFKKSIVEQDETEHGMRKALNFGHTIGHGIEAVKGVKGRRTVGLYHGECVALGMLPMIESKALQKRVRAVYRRLGLPLRTAYNKDKVYAEMLHDKKAQGGQITVIKVPGLGCWRAETIPVEGLRPLLGMED